jgi:riboflavin biosynthesis pyrimidine reductase
MAVQADPEASSEADLPLRLRRLLPPAEPATVAEIIEDLGLRDRPAAGPGRPRVLLNMVSTVDGRATVDGRSGTISDRADRELFHGLRGAVDAVLVGAGTVRMERYGRMIREESHRRLRRERGLCDEPLACIVSGRLALEADIPLLADPEARVVIVTSSAASLPATGARVEYVRAQRDGRLDLPAALAELRARLDVQVLLCEGGPHLALQLIAAGLLDELFLSLSPMLAGGEAASGEALRILAGPELEPPLGLELLGVLECDSHLFLRYGLSDGVSSGDVAGDCSAAPSGDSDDLSPGPSGGVSG